MPKLAIDARADEVSQELARLGIAADTQVLVVVEVGDDALPMAALAQAGGAFDWLADEPDLYSDACLVSSRP